VRSLEQRAQAAHRDKLGTLGDRGQVEATPIAESDDQLAAFKRPDGFVEKLRLVKERRIEGLTGVLGDVPDRCRSAFDFSNVEHEGVASGLFPGSPKIEVWQVTALNDAVQVGVPSSRFEAPLEFDKGTTAGDDGCPEAGSTKASERGVEAIEIRL
jgi:hypothetical protein